MIQVGFVCISLSTPTPESVKYPIVADSWDLPVPNCCPELIGSPVDRRNS
ncbi:unnamed protein product, partial [Musa acuminata subsp. burmannicoides]